MRLVRPTSRRVFAAAVLVLTAAGLAAAPIVPEEPAAYAATGEESAVTVEAGDGPFKGLKVTVAQTKHVTSQAIEVTWTGGKATRGNFEANYLTFMQCWGPDPDAADFRETCQYGNSAASALYDGLTGPYTAARGGLRTTPDAADPLPEDATIVPFRSVAGRRTPDGSAADPIPAGTNELLTLSPYFDQYSTNEITAARTTGDGTGRVVFEAQTAVEAPALGCGLTITDAAGSHPRACWLVIVPRGDTYINGDPVPELSRLSGSPLRTSTFAHKLAVPLAFDPIGSFCRLGARERRTVGSELVAEAVTSWQPALCAGEGPVFGYSQTGDGEARRQVASGHPGAPGMAFTSSPVTSADGASAVAHGPVALSGAVVAFNIDADFHGAADPALRALDATAVKDLKLTPRLVAKMLTQSYLGDVPGGNQGRAEHLKGNPRSPVNDPEFLELNPVARAFPALSYQPDGLLVAIGDSAAAREVWRWILADQQAREWLTGTPDEGGMKVNPYYKLTDPAVLDTRVDFPKADPSCHRVNDSVPAPGYCGLDLRPYMNSMRQAAYQTLRGDARQKIVWDPLKVPPQFVASSPRSPGRRFNLAITDAASAARYGLYTAALRNRAGEFVKPTTQGLLTGAAAMTPSSVDGVLQTAPGMAAPGAYPLTMVAYAAVAKGQDAAALRDYAAFLRHAAGPGQEPGKTAGKLPAGYAPLPASLREAARKAADSLEAVAATKPSPTPAAPGSGVNGAPSPGSGPSGPSSSQGTPVNASAEESRTQAIVLGIVRFAVAAALLLGATGVLAGPSIRRFAERRSGAVN